MNKLHTYTIHLLMVLYELISNVFFFLSVEESIPGFPPRVKHHYQLYSIKKIIENNKNVS